MRASSLMPVELADVKSRKEGKKVNPGMSFVH